ncbi:hypothetical protein RB614_40605 [Phytohabitans sp. ZYX-F-186]|uniref:Uncharacterized protein n=1 Tax=Phytohabitans maris TaxID=3071409 RepID=A0ABU0ZUZ8_9ACTN|nr:hypothetical protein [Phytohabitans sp. ZYX-F-186]MDQ7910812.1 hypothetical protein [Phytohabitans sp. ZYX-F-186]
MTSSPGAARLRSLTTAAERGDAAALAALAEALFCAALQPSDQPTAEQVRAAIGEVVHRCDGDQRTCACDLAERYGADPERARDRMSWCRNVVTVTYCVTGDPGDSAYLRALFWRRA